jgi:hypothetical protein
MANLNEIKKAYADISANYNPVGLLKLKELLLADNEKDTLLLHYELLHNRAIENIYFALRSFFADRSDKDQVATFLYSLFAKEDDNITQGDIIQILGHMRHKLGLNLAEQNYRNAHSIIRYKSLIVLGWMGTEKHLSILFQVMSKDFDSKNRGFAATSMRQIWYNYPKTKDKILSYLKLALIKESEEDALEMIIVTIQELLKKKLGLKESSRGQITGDVVAAKEKSVLALQSY